MTTGFKPIPSPAACNAVLDCREKHAAIGYPPSGDLAAQIRRTRALFNIACEYALRVGIGGGILLLLQVVYALVGAYGADALPTPAPSTLFLLGTGLAAGGIRRRRRRTCA